MFFWFKNFFMFQTIFNDCFDILMGPIVIGNSHVGNTIIIILLLPERSLVVVDNS